MLRGQLKRRAVSLEPFELAARISELALAVRWVARELRRCGLDVRS
jgi:hypothetical protein